MKRSQKKRSPSRKPQSPSSSSRRRKPMRLVSSAERSIKAPAVIDKNRKGFAYLIFDSKDLEDQFLSPRIASKFFHGDRVEVTVKGGTEIEELRLISRRFSELVGVFRRTSTPKKAQQGRGVCVYQRRSSKEEVLIPKADPRLTDGTWIRVRLLDAEGDASQIRGQIEEVYGPELPARADLPMIAGEFGWIEEHSAEAKAEAMRLVSHDKPLDLEHNRKDFRSIPFVTIDGATARDFDDAVYVERISGGGYKLWVGIADVAHYVQPGSAIDTDAYSRATSVYFPEKAFHMLPSELSENLCSLRPNEPKKSLVAILTYNKEGTRISTEVHNALIESKKRWIYEDLQEEYRLNQNNPKWDYQPHFDLYHLLRLVREKRGAIDFEFPEPEILVDAEGEPQSLTIRERVDSHRLIEEFMIAANEAVTDFAVKHKVPFVFRIHSKPEIESLYKFQKLANSLGYSKKIKLDPDDPKTIADFVRDLKGDPLETLLSQQILRSMKQAVYNAHHDIHFGLASVGYTHFTSPIRRYPDLIVHRILKELIAKESIQVKERQAELEEATTHCSYRERLAADAERESIRIKQIRIAKRHLGETFDGSIVGMTEKGLFVQVRDPYFEGFLNKDEFTDDSYSFREETMTYVGRRKRKTMRIGESIKIRVVRADLESRKVDFERI